MPKAAFHLHHPDRRDTCCVFASPHSGRDYPAWFVQGSPLDALTIRSSEDAFVDQLFSAAPRYGAPLLLAGAPRAFVDLNRSADELDPALIDGVRQSGHNPRVAAGLGVIPRVVAGGRAIHTGKLPLAEAERRLDRIWRPYHAALAAEMEHAHTLFGRAILIDCHSMPREAMDGTVRPGARRPDVVLGDRYGASSAPEITDGIEQAFAAAGLTVARNTPFAGAYVTQTYGRPSRGRHAIQIEIDRALYMDEKKVRPSADFTAFCALLDGVVGRIAAIGRAASMPLAAE
ncbi:N-formylglutamate amidohydrolase [Pelagivirga sediminicola]|uniref:N-formylglutamate amidohydrolase n=1 Tax=Pelagivirga sediminicola TaxID=2170575 RepID=A0A2T7G824_9RHOB|nr:N-formylglutamate amidohydrolase [Pelagivirga sediminicola]PVA10546.1 N-formylglutamate amidohydrolase [Pelagivirga sediminicola]